MRRIHPEPSGELTDDELAGVYAMVPGAEPLVRVNFVSSVDGAVTVDGVSGGLGTPGDKRVFGLLRDLCDVILVGAGTVRAEGYVQARPSARRRERRRALGLAEVPTVAVVSGSLDFDPASPLFTDAETDARTVVLTTEAAPADRRAALARVADVVDAGTALIDPAMAVAALGSRGLNRVLCEGGPALFGTLLAARVVDELCLTVSPRLAGPGAPRIIAGLPTPVQPLTLRHVLEDGDTLLLRYQLG